MLTNVFSPASPTSKTYADLCAKLKEHFVPEKVEIAEVHRFYRRKQKNMETVQDFLADLRQLAKDCNFGDLKRALRDAFVLGLLDQRIQSRLLSTRNLTLELALGTAQSMEIAALHTKQLRQLETPTGEDDLNYVKTGDQKKKKTTPKCFRCGNPDHLAPACPHADKTCSSCNKKGHLSSVCQSKQGGSGRGRKEKATGGRVHQLEPEEDELFGQLYYHTESGEAVHSTRAKPFIQPVLVGQMAINMEIDTGCPVTLLPDSLWKKLGSSKLQSSTLRLRTYTGGKLIILGEFTTPVTINGSTKPMLVMVVEGEGSALLGRNWLLQTQLDWQKVHRLSEAEGCPAEMYSQLRPYKDVFSGDLGLIKTAPVHLDLKPGAVPNFHRPRPVPFALHDRVKTKLDRLEKTGVLTKVQHSDWAAPVVVVDKPDRGTRICGDYKGTINPQILVDQYPLPRPDDIFSSLQGGVYFSKQDLSQAYFQLELDEESQKLVTINTIQGLYRYTRLPFGVASAPAKFQQVMDNLLVLHFPYFSFQDKENERISGKLVEEKGRKIRELQRKILELAEKKSSSGATIPENAEIYSDEGVCLYL